jgi:predicted nucleic acid-binding Zn ribbon protein
VSREGPEPLADVLGRLFAARGWGRQQERRQLEEVWKGVLADLGLSADKTQLGALRRGVLEVTVQDAVLLHEMSQFHKRRLLENLRSALGPERVTELRFRLGAVNQ